MLRLPRKLGHSNGPQRTSTSTERYFFDSGTATQRGMLAFLIVFLFHLNLTFSRTLKQFETILIFTILESLIDSLLIFFLLHWNEFHINIFQIVSINFFSSGNGFIYPFCSFEIIKGFNIFYYYYSGRFD